MMPLDWGASCVLHNVDSHKPFMQEVHVREWQLFWAVPAADTAAFGARAVLPLLRVNPQPEARQKQPALTLSARGATCEVLPSQHAHADGPPAPDAPAALPQLPVPWTILMSAAHLQLTVLASAGVITDDVASPAHEAAVVDFDQIQVWHALSSLGWLHLVQMMSRAAAFATPQQHFPLFACVDVALAAR